MKLRIKARGHNILLWFPTSLLKSRLAYSILQHAVSKEVNKRTKSVSAELYEQQGQTNTKKEHSILITRQQHLELYNALKRCLKDNGHFNLVEVESHDGEKVLIRV